MKTFGMFQFLLAGSPVWTFYHIVVNKLRQTPGILGAAGRKVPLQLGVPILMVMRAAAADESVLWELDLSEYEPGPAANIAPGVEVIEEDGKRMVRKTNDETQFLFGRQLRTQEAMQWDNIQFRVRFRETGKPTFTIAVKQGGLRGEIGYQWYYVGIRPEALSSSCRGLPKELPDGIEANDPRIALEVKYADLGLNAIAEGDWVDVEVAVGNEVIKVSVVTEDGVKRETEFPTFPGTGSVSILSRSPLDIASASVRDAEKEVVASP